jgi:aryl carrier-like protein
MKCKEGLGVDQNFKRLVVTLLERQIPPTYKTTPLAGESNLLDFGLDSLNMMSFWLALEQESPQGIDLGKLDFAVMDTVADVMQHVERLYAFPSDVP